ncbi:MAG: hypothetical protein IIB73_05170 [Proteobacteria bacterium]|nr:hypothetical protein [Pseudomonadota bacterium]
MDDTLSFIVYVLFGAIGLGYFVYGKRQKKIVPLICGVGLMGYPYFVNNATLLVIIGCILLGIPYFVRY